MDKPSMGELEHAQALADALIADGSSDLRPDYLREAIMVCLSSTDLTLTRTAPPATSDED